MPLWSAMPIQGGALTLIVTQFLSFFKLAIRFLAITFFFSLVVILPVHVHFTGDYGYDPDNGNNTNAATYPSSLDAAYYAPAETPGTPDSFYISTDYLWMYLGFVYLFTGIAIWLIVKETQKIIRIRQDYLGSQSTVTDRTIRLSGIPPELRSEEMVKEAIENLQIGKVESVTLCKDWGELDGLISQRMNVLRKLEEAWTVHLGHQRSSKSPSSRPALPNETGDEESRLLNGDDHISSYVHDRPTTRVWYGFLKLQSRQVDAIDYYEERLRKLDEQIKSARRKEYKPTPLAFVTLDSTAAAVSLPTFLLTTNMYFTDSNSKWQYKQGWIRSPWFC